MRPAHSSNPVVAHTCKDWEVAFSPGINTERALEAQTMPRGTNQSDARSENAGRCPRPPQHPSCCRKKSRSRNPTLPPIATGRARVHACHKQPGQRPFRSAEGPLLRFPPCSPLDTLTTIKLQGMRRKRGSPAWLLLTFQIQIQHQRKPSRRGTTHHADYPIDRPAQRLQCRHILPEGRRCDSPCLRGERFC